MLPELQHTGYKKATIQKYMATKRQHMFFKHMINRVLNLVLARRWRF